MYQSLQTCTWHDCHSPGWTPTLTVHPSPSLVLALASVGPFAEGGNLQPRKDSQQLALLMLPRHCILLMQFLVLAEAPTKRGSLSSFILICVPCASCHVTKKHKQTQDWFSTS